MKLTPLELPALLLMTTSPLTRAFFERANAKLRHTNLICSECLIDAFDLLNRTVISCIVIDEDMPNLDLTKACMEIRQLKDHQCTPIVIITSRLKKSFMHHLLKAGATDFLIEPLEEEELVCCMKRAKSVKQTRKKLSRLSFFSPSQASHTVSMRERTILDGHAMKLVSEMLRSNQRITLILLEVDQYSLIRSAEASVVNDLFTRVQMHLKTAIRRQDLLFPQKKGTFLILLPQTTSKAALFIAENLQESVKLQPFSVRGRQFELSVSVGLISLDEKTPRKKGIASLFDYLIQRAKTCLEKAKKEKDSIVVYNSRKGIFLFTLLLNGITFHAQGTLPSVGVLSPSNKASVEEIEKREMSPFFSKEQGQAPLAQSGLSEIMIIDPKTRAQDVQEVFEYLRKKSPSSRLTVKLVNHSLIRDILDVILMSNGTMIIFRIHSPQGHRFEVVKIEDIETITNSYGNDSSYLFKKSPHPRAALPGRSASAHN